MKKIFIFYIILAVCLPAALFAGKNIEAFLLEDTDAKSFSMGSAYTAVSDNPGSLAVNPAGLGYLLTSEIALNYKKNLLDGYNGSAFFAFPVRDLLTIGFGAALYDPGNVELNYPDGTSETVGAMQSRVFNLGLGIKIFNELTTGLNIKYINSALTDKYSGTTFAADLGLLLRTYEDSFSLGLAFQNIGTKLAYISLGDPLPFTIRTGAGIKIKYAENFTGTASADIVYYNDKARCNLGTELSISNILLLRAGYKLGYAPDVLTLGFGLRIGQIEIDYGYSIPGTTDRMQMLTVSYSFASEADYDIGMMYYRKGAVSRALQYLSRVEKEDSNYQNAQKYIGIEELLGQTRALIKDNDYEGADKICKMALQTDPENLNAKMLEKKEINPGLIALGFRRQAKIYKETKYFEKAIEYYWKGLESLPKNEKYCAENMYLMGECFEEKGDSAASSNALIMYNEVINSYPGYVWAAKAVKKIKEITAKTIK